MNDRHRNLVIDLCSLCPVNICEVISDEHRSEQELLPKKDERGVLRVDPENTAHIHGVLPCHPVTQSSLQLVEQPVHVFDLLQCIPYI